jgi:Entner-Doudoroff aldolase
MGFSDDWFAEAFSTTQVMAILRGFGVQRSLEVSRLAWEAGVTSVELPIQTPDDVEALRAVAAEARERGLSVGAGTVIDAEQVAIAKDAGAAYTVSPGSDPDVIEASLDAGLPTLPGVATASEIQRVRRLGLSWFKAFPAAQLTPAWIPAMHGPFPDAVFVVTGGITVENAGAFLDAGARVVSLGSALADPDQLARIRPLVART